MSAHGLAHSFPHGLVFANKEGTAPTTMMSKRYSAANVILQWCSLAANITMMAAM